MKISRHSLIFGLSYALDIAGNNNLSHSKSTAYLAANLGRELGLPDSEILVLYYAALLHDIGVSNEYFLYEHCEKGAEMLARLPLPDAIPLMVLYHHELYNGGGPHRLAGEDIPLGAQIISFSSLFDDTFGRKGGGYHRDLYLEVTLWLKNNAILYSPAIRGAMERRLPKEAFLLDYFSAETRYTLARRAVVDDDVFYDYDGVLAFASCFADIIDRRSPFTYTHSRGIARLARQASRYLGYNGDIQNEMYLAGLLHDIGKLAVPVAILHKDGKLDDEERFAINKHTYYSRKILEQIPGFERIVEYAANHHEKMCGTGYPYRIKGDRLSELERVMAVCDVYQALAEERPYRPGMPEEKIWAIIGEMGENAHLDSTVAEKLRHAFEAPVMEA